MLPNRRAVRRTETPFTRACIIAEETVALARLLNFSIGGASFQTAADLAIGGTVRYFWKPSCCMSATVVWREGSTYGVRHKEVSRNAAAAFPTRPVRIDCGARPACLVGRTRFSAFVENISLGGMRIVGLPPLEAGVHMAIALCERNPMAARVRWYRKGVAGIRLTPPMTPGLLSHILLDRRFSMDGADG